MGIKVLVPYNFNDFRHGRAGFVRSFWFQEVCLGDPQLLGAAGCAEWVVAGRTQIGCTGEGSFSDYNIASFSRKIAARDSTPSGDCKYMSRLTLDAMPLATPNPATACVPMTRLWGHVPAYVYTCRGLEIRSAICAQTSVV